MHHTGVGIQSFYLLVTLSFTDPFFLITPWTFWHVFARTRVLSSHSLSTTPCSPVSDGFDEAPAKEKSCPSIERERKTQSGRRSVYPDYFAFLLCEFVFLLCLFRHLLEVIATRAE
jgi:hypothetical protein